MAVRSRHESRERNKQSDFGLVTDSGCGWEGWQEIYVLNIYVFHV